MDFLAKHWGDLASVLGIALTVWFAWRAKSAAEQARAAAQAVKERLTALDALADIGAAIEILQEIMRIQRRDEWGPVAWNTALDRYGLVRLQLTRCKGGPVAESQQNTIEEVLQHFRIIMDEIEEARTEDERQRLDPGRFNRVIARQVERLEAIRIAIKKA